MEINRDSDTIAHVSSSSSSLSEVQGVSVTVDAFELESLSVSEMMSVSDPYLCFKLPPSSTPGCEAALSLPLVRIEFLTEGPFGKDSLKSSSSKLNTGAASQFLFELEAKGAGVSLRSSFPFSVYNKEVEPGLGLGRGVGLLLPLMPIEGRFFTVELA